MINLSDTTLISIDGTGYDFNALKALKISCKNFNFKKVKLLSASDIKNNFCETVKINKMNMAEYNLFCLKELWKYIETENFLLVQSDGFIINNNLWDYNFLNYDYIGAAWSRENVIATCMSNQTLYNSLLNNKELYQVGNGGFSLRSKKLSILTSKIFKEEYKNLPEDIIIGVAMREELEKQNILFANLDIAMKFSVENIHINGKTLSTSNSFGFHGKMVHPQLLGKLQEE